MEARFGVGDVIEFVEFMDRRFRRLESLLRRVLSVQEELVLDQTKVNAAPAALAQEVSETAELVRGLKDAP